MLDTMQVDIVVYDGLDEMDALGPLEVLRSAAKSGADLTARLVVRTPQPMVLGAYGLQFRADAVYRSGQADVLLVPGGGWAVRAAVGAWGEVPHATLAGGIMSVQGAKQIRVDPSVEVR